jgi:hypothetical protein
MKANVGSVDKIVRIILGLVGILLGLVLHSWWGLVGVALILTAVFSFCPLYTLLKVNTIKKAK